ncbi:hypothetical protein [Thiocapsa sp.]|uniref:hypothetical protein n=1 Tax=Thiocapsa sp. TaxID=2024551 RepID=UPI002600D825|nr:hypothetical protein [Thiocapsa sp.]
MRTTLDIDDQVLNAAKEIARRQRKTAGAVISELARRALTQPLPEQQAPLSEPQPFCGFRPLASEGRVVTDDLVERLREQDGV